MRGFKELKLFHSHKLLLEKHQSTPLFIKIMQEEVRYKLVFMKINYSYGMLEICHFIGIFKPFSPNIPPNPIIQVSHTLSFWQVTLNLGGEELKKLLKNQNITMESSPLSKSKMDFGLNLHFQKIQKEK